MKINISRNITIQKSAHDVYKVISDLNKWNLWSPWVHCEPTCKTEISGQASEVGQSQTWVGEVIGSGKMTLTGLVPNHTVKIKLEFLKPFHSTADVVLSITENQNNQVTVNWSMQTNLPFYMFFFKKMMMAYMINDFDRGLKMLKDLVETGEVLSKSTYEGEVKQSGFQIIGKKTKCTISDMTDKMKADCDQLLRFANSGEMIKPDSAITLYHKFDIPNGQCEYTAGFAYSLEKIIKIPIGYERIQIPNHKAIRADHYGAYRFMGNPWGMIMSYQRGHKKKIDKEIPMYETYMSHPETSERDTYTQVILPVR